MKNNQKTFPSADTAKPTTSADVIKYIISHSCIYFTAVAIILLIAQSISAGDSEKTIEPLRFLLIYPFTLAVAAADCIFKARSLGTGTKATIHYAITVLAFYLFVCAPAKSAANPIVIVLFLSFIYFLIATPILIVFSSVKKKKSKEVPYQSVYGKVTKK